MGVRFPPGAPAFRRPSRRRIRPRRESEQADRLRERRRFAPERPADCDQLRDELFVARATRADTMVCENEAQEMHETAFDVGRTRAGRRRNSNARFQVARAVTRWL